MGKFRPGATGPRPNCWRKPGRDPNHDILLSHDSRCSSAQAQARVPLDITAKAQDLAHEVVEVRLNRLSSIHASPKSASAVQRKTLHSVGPNPGLRLYQVLILKNASFAYLTSANAQISKTTRRPPSVPRHLFIARRTMSSKKSKKPLKPLAKHLLFGIPANIAAGPLGFRAELDKGEPNFPHRGLKANQSDSAAILDEENPGPSRIVFHKSESGFQGPPAPGSSTAVVIPDVEQSNRPTSKYPRTSSPQPKFIRIAVPLPLSGDYWSEKTGRGTRSVIKWYASTSPPPPPSPLTSVRSGSGPQ